MANKFKNTMTIKLGEQSREIVANFDALSAIQTESGRGELENVRRFGRGQFGIKDLTCIIHNGLRAGGDNRLNRTEVGNLILESKNYDQFAAYCVEFLTLALDTGEEGGGKGNEEEAPKSE